MTNYVNFLVKSCYSMGESLIKIDDLINFAKKNKIKTLAIADTNVMFGAAEFYFSCRKADIKPIIGMEIKHKEANFYAFSKNADGYNYLIELSSKLNLLNPTFSFDVNRAKNLLIISGKRYKFFQDSEIVNINKLPNSPTQYLYPKDQRGLELLWSLNSNENKRMDKQFVAHYVLEVNKEKAALTIEIASQCNLELKTKTFDFPVFDKSRDSKVALQKKCFEQLFKKIAQPNQKVYIKRLNYELNVISEMNFQDYFLAVYDFVKWAKNQKIIIGPGRGSAASSLVCYLLSITTIDPIKHKLLFERFLNRERISLPDIDLDIEDERRNEVLDYIFSRYNTDSVAQIITFQKFGPRMALRDTLKFLGVNLRDIDEYAKAIPFMTKSLKNAYRDVVAFRSLVDSNPIIKDAFTRAQLLEGIPRQVGSHAAGIVLSSQNLASRIPTIEVEGRLHTQYDMRYLEYFGIVKIDVLGLKNLTVIKKIQDQLYVRHGRRVKLEEIPLTDKKVNNLFSTARTNGIFQFESPGMKRTLRQVKISKFSDLVAVIALFRPGPMQNIATFAERKNNHKKFKLYKSKILNTLLEETYGVIVFQEQVMLIASHFAGFSFSKADLLRRAMSKKKAHVMEAIRKDFFASSQALGRDEAEINEVYDLIEKFAQYGFNKAHATAYSTISYWMAFFKAYFPVEFYSAIFDLEMKNLQKVKVYLSEAKLEGIKFTQPHINFSETKFIYHNGKILFPLSMVKGVGNETIKKIIEERSKNGLFKSFFIAIARLKFIGIGEANIDNLVKANCFREFGKTSTLKISLQAAFRFTKMSIVKKDNNLKLNLKIVPEPKIANAKPDIEQDAAYEFSAIGMNINFHPIVLLKVNRKIRLVEAIKVYKSRVLVRIDHVKRILTSTKKEMAKIWVSDETCEVEIVVFPDTFAKVANNLIANRYGIISVYKNKNQDLVMYSIELIEDMNE